MDTNSVNWRMLRRLGENLAIQTVVFWLVTGILVAFGFSLALTTSLGVWACLIAANVVGWAIGWALAHRVLPRD